MYCAPASVRSEPLYMYVVRLVWNSVSPLPLSALLTVHDVHPLQTNSTSHAHAPVPTMSFHLSAEDIRVEDNHILKARLGTISGEWQDAEFDLNEVLGNQDGMVTHAAQWLLDKSADPLC